MDNPTDPWRPSSTLRIYLGDECNLQCPSCCLDGGPGKGASTTPEEISQTLDEMRTFPSIARVRFTGGEPFRMLDLLKEGVTLATEKGYQNVTIASNGYLIKEEDLSELVAIAKDYEARIRINLSQDEMHGCSKDYPVLKRLIRLQGKLGFDISVFYVQTPDSTHENQTALEEICKDENIAFGTMTYIPDGRAAQFFKGERDIQIDEKELDKLQCWSNGPIMAYGNLLMCDFAQYKNEDGKNLFAIPLGPGLAQRIRNHPYLPIFRQMFSTRGNGRGVVKIMKNLYEAGLPIPKAGYDPTQGQPYACTVCKNLTKHYFDKALELLK